MKFISYALAAALSIITTSPVDAASVVTDVNVGLDVDLGCKSIVEIAKGVDKLSTLVAAVDAAGLADTLSGDGPFTLFAPVDTAFEALPEGTVETLLKPENKGQLTSTLTYHVVAGKVMSGDLVDGPVQTVNGADVIVDVTNIGIKINQANVKKADIEACNGVVHLIDAVLTPPPPPEPETSSPTDTLNSKSGKSTVAKASKAGSTSAKAGKSDTDKMKMSSSAKADKSDTDKMKMSSSAKAEKAAPRYPKAAKDADEPDVPEEKPDVPEEPKAEDESDKAEDEEEEKEEEDKELSLLEAAFAIVKIMLGGKRKLSSHLRG